MALRLNQTVGSVIMFEVKDRRAKLRVDEMQADEVTFKLLVHDQYSRPRRSVGSILNFQMRGELISIHVDEFRANKVALRIDASPAVRIMRREALMKRVAAQKAARARPAADSE